MSRRRAVILIPVVSVAALLATYGGATAKAARTSSHSLAGTWSGKYGGAFSGTFKLHWRQYGSKLSGSITLSFPRGTYQISGHVRGKELAFGAVGAGATYTGSVSGRSMSGHYRTPQGGGTWSAHKMSP